MKELFVLRRKFTVLPLMFAVAALFLTCTPIEGDFDTVLGKARDKNKWDGNKTVDGLVIVNNPTKMVYSLGESFDPIGLVVKANYSDGSSEFIPNSALYFSGFESLTPGPKGVQINYKGKSVGLTVTVGDALI